MLDTALDLGISEWDYWSMTLAEALRAIESKKRVYKLQAQEKASYDYILADMIGRSIARLYSSSAKLPSIAEMYPTLFDGEEIEERRREKLAELSALRFKQFVENHNTKFKEVANKDE